MSKYLLMMVIFVSTAAFGQKKPLDHSVYDSWQTIGKKTISNDGKWVVYNIDVQEGDNELIIQSSDATVRKSFPRGYNASVTEDNRFVVFSIKPFFKEIKDAKIKKKKPEDQPKDSFAIIELATQKLFKKANVKSFKTPENNYGWVAYHLVKGKDSIMKKSGRDNGKMISDSLQKVIDSLQTILEIKANSKVNTRNQLPVDDAYAADEENPDAADDGGSNLVLRNLATKEEKIFPNVSSYFFNKNGGKLLMEQKRDSKDSLSKELVILYDVNMKKLDTLSRGGNDFKNFTISDDGTQVAFVAERDAKPKELQKFYKLWYYKTGMDSASLLVDKNAAGIQKNMTISENAKISFSKSGKRIIFGTSFILPPKDTTLIEMDLVKLDIWNYKDDYLQPVQLNRVKRDLQKSYLAVYDLEQKKLAQLASKEIPDIYVSAEGDGDFFIGVTDFGRRTESQWTGNTKKDIYWINANNGSKKIIKKNLEGMVSPSGISPSGKYVVWYDTDLKNYFAFDGAGVKNITSNMKVLLYNEEHDQPSDAFPYGIMGWQDGDNSMLIYDRYDIWKVDPSNKKSPENITGGQGRKNKITYRYLRTDSTEKFIDTKKEILLSTFDNTTKKNGITVINNNALVNKLPATIFSSQPYFFSAPVKAKDAPVLIYTKENYTSSPNLYVYETGKNEQSLSDINAQQKEYNWGIAQLYKWRTFSGKSSTGILYKPEDFDSTKKYPIIFYFYEKLSDGLYKYQAPAPTASRLNISFFVSRGYLVFAPDIEYIIGHPAKSAYDYIVSAAKDLAKNKWVDAANMGLQGQSWGGIQVAQIITMTPIFKAAWAGAPVANMTSAYGGIRWETGVSRQFQYEKTQSRIGGTLWQKPELYIESSPLFHLPKVKTPLVIMANDADGAVPWYQGIELFTGMVRLGKPVWMLNYNGEAHNLVLRKNRKDIQIREQQFFDWMLKGAKPAKWITEGVPAMRKGSDWGLDLEE